VKGRSDTPSTTRNITSMKAKTGPALTLEPKMGIIVLVMGAKEHPLFGATRQGVLALLFGHPDNRFYQRQIIQTVGLGSGAVQRELAQLARAGILTRTLEGRQTYFQANRRCQIFDELRGLVRKTFGVSQVVKDALVALRSRIQFAFIFGSVATGAETSASDIDLMVIGDVSLMDVVSALSDAQRELAREVNPCVYPLKEFCRKLAEGQHFITRVVAGPKLYLIGDEQSLTGLAQIRVAQGAQDKSQRGRRSSGRR
jgi:predicted nucleotidyltransferase